MVSPRLERRERKTWNPPLPRPGYSCFFALDDELDEDFFAAELDLDFDFEAVFDFEAFALGDFFEFFGVQHLRPDRQGAGVEPVRAAAQHLFQDVLDLRSTYFYHDNYAYQF